MKSKSDLKRKVLCSLLAASTMGIFYSSDALAASVNGVELPEAANGIITDDWLVKEAESKKFIIAQGDKVVVATQGDVNLLLKDLAAIKNNTTMSTAEKITAIRDALTANSVIGVVGGESQLDKGMLDAFTNIRDGAVTNNALVDSVVQTIIGIDLSDVSGKIVNINTVTETNAVKDGDTSLTIGGEVDGKLVQPVVIGAVGGDLSVNTGLNGSLNMSVLPDYPSGGTQSGEFTSQETSIVRNGNVNLNIASGNVLGGVGGSAAITVGNITVEAQAALGNSINIDVDLALNGKANTTLNGDVQTVVGSDASVGAFANGGGAIAIGGEATSVVNGDSNLYINGDDTVMTKGVNGVAAGVSGGGVAASVDATGLAEELIDPSKQYGNDEGYVDIDGSQITNNEQFKDNLNIKIDNAVQGGTATATTKDTNITLQGTSTGVGVIGGGLAAAAHTYTWKGDGTGTEEDKAIYEVNDEYGKSVAEANTGKATINVALNSKNFDRVKFMEAISGMKDAVSSIADGSEFAGLDAAKEALKGAANQGAAAGIFGGGMAVSQSGNRNNMYDEGLNDQGAFATANTAGADINLYSGYAAGVFGGGVAAAINNSHAEANMTDTVNINVYNTMNEEDKNTVIGIFGNGLAYYTGSYKTSTGENANLEGAAKVTAKDTNINVDGMVDGIVNGGLAIDDSEADTTNAIVSTETGTINIGSSAVVNAINFDGFTDLVGKVPADKIDMASYVAGVGDAADGVAVAAGGVAVGGGAESTVKNAEVNVFGTVNGDIIGGGVAAYGFDETNGDGEAKGAHVENSTLNLYTGANITGDVYAGGSASDMTKGGTGYDKAQAIVDNATINLAGATVSGVLTGAGVSGTDNDVALNSTLNLIGENTLSLIKGESEGVQDSSKFDGFTNFNATANSVTKVEGLNDTTALIDAEGTTVTVDGSAKLDINELAVGNTYKVISGTDEADVAWTNSNLVYDRTEGYAAGTEVATGSYDINYKDLNDLTEEEQDKAVNDFVGSLGEGGEELRGNVEGIVKNGDNTFAGAKDFFGDFTSGNGSSRDLGAMAMIGEAAGVSSNTISVAGDMADNSVLRLSFTQDDITGEPTVNEDGAVWAKYIHNKHDLDGMASSFGSIDSSSDFDGATIGVDFAKKGKVQSGIAFSYGDGDSHGMGINNDFDMWGVTLYGNVKNDDSNVIADVGFSESDNELTGKAMGKDIKADRDVSVFTVGVRAEKLYTEGSTQIVPYTGLRYYSVDPDSYTAYYDGAKFGEYDADRQNIWTLPVGVSLRNETVTESGWKIVPQANVAYIWAFGDTDNSFDLNTGSGVSTLDYTVMDSGSWLGSLGIEAGKDDWNFGLGYSYQKGSHAEANKWFVNVEYSF